MASRIQNPSTANQLLKPRVVAAMMGHLVSRAANWVRYPQPLPLAIRLKGVEVVLLTIEPPNSQAWLQYVQGLVQEFKTLTIGPFQTTLDRGSLRSDQVRAARHWGIDLGESDERQHFEILLRQLAQRSREAGRILDLRPGWQNLHLPGLISDDLEALMLDVLNEEEPVARHATLTEDFLERTDLRVRYPDLHRKRGARVQVSWAATPEAQFSKSGTFLRREEYVFVSPLELSRASKKWKDGSHWAAWFRRALDARCEHPWGPAASLPPEMREEIRAYVHAESLKATEELRKREEAIGQFHTRRKRRKWSGERLNLPESNESEP